jgi:hypothetical protein
MNTWTCHFGKLRSQIQNRIVTFFVFSGLEIKRPVHFAFPEATKWTFTNRELQAESENFLLT